MHSVLFVCTANQCRSPMAEGLLKLRVGLDNDEWRITSSGTWADDGSPASVNAVTVMKERGFDLTAHESQTVNQELISEHRLILTMERGHKEALRLEFPQSAGKIFLLSEMIGKIFDIDDPVGSPIIEYQDTAREIDAILGSGFSRLAELSRDLNPTG
jgi:protein-tyrosine-phosphatase